MVGTAEPRCRVLVLLLLLLQCFLRISAIRNCNFSSEVSVKPQQIVLTCACPVRSVTDPWLSISVVSRSWAVSLRQLLVNPVSLPNQSPIRQTYAYTISSKGDPRLRFKCVTHGLDHYSHANRDDDYFLTLNLLDYFTKAVSTSTTISTSTSTAKQPTTRSTTTLQPIATPQQPRAALQQRATSQQPHATSQQPHATSQQPHATSQQPGATSQQPRTAQQQKATVEVTGSTTGEAGSSNLAGVVDPSGQSGKAVGQVIVPSSHIHSDQKVRSQDEEDVVEEEILVIPMKILILVVVCSVLSLMVVALTIVIISKRRCKKQRAKLQPPAFCGRQANDDVQMDVLTKALIRLLPPQQTGRGSAYSGDDRFDLALSSCNSSLSGSAYAVCSIPANVQGTRDDRALGGERPGDFSRDPFPENGFENESHQASHFGQCREHQYQGIRFENEVQQASIYDEIDDTFLYDDLTKTSLYDDVGEPSQTPQC